MFESEVVEKKYLTKDVVFLSLTCPEDFSFKAGQYVMFKMDNGEKRKMKPYSILSPPSQKGRLDFCIKIVEGGFASEMFKTMEIGAKFPVRGPMGHFVFKEDSEKKKFCFIGTGTGIAPFFSMVQEFVPKMPDKDFQVIFGLRNKAGLFLHDEFLALAKKYSNFTYLPTLSREKWEGKTGRVQTHLTEDLLEKEFYICGLKEMVLDTQKHLEEQGVSSSHIHFERYS